MDYVKPSTAIARVLRGLGLKQGHDFRVKGEYKGSGANRERVGTYVVVLSNAADQTVADHADEIEQLTSESGNSFRVSIHFTAGGRMWTWVANYGQRTRDQAPATRMPAASTNAHPAPESRKAVKQIETRPGRTAAPVIRATLGAPRPAFERPDAHPYDGLAQKRFGALYWACEQAGSVWFFQNGRQSPRYTLRVYTGRAQVNGWYLSGPGLDSDRWLGKTLAVAAEAAEDVILGFQDIANAMESCVRDWPKGTRVQGVDSYGVTCMGTVNGVSWGVVTATGHANYGKTWVDVSWDEMPHNRGTGRRNRPLTEDLIRH